MPGKSYDAASIEVLEELGPSRPRSAGYLSGDPPLSDMARAVLRLWDGRPDARLNAVGDVALPLSKATNRSVIGAVNELAAMGLLAIPDGLLLTGAGKALLEMGGDHDG